MQLKGLVKFFAAALILICLYQLSFTWFVHSFEGDQRAKAEKTVRSQMQPAAAKYPNDKELQARYQDSIDRAVSARYRRLLDSNANTSVTWWGNSYNSAKDKEMKLGLDLQGGMAVTLEVGLDGLIRSKSNNSKEPAFNQALGEALAQKANGGADLITLFADAYKKNAPNNKLAPLFAVNSNKKVTLQSSDNDVISYLRKEAELAFDNTFHILQTRIDQFGVASPTINPDKAKNVITVELAGVTDKERVRKYLQSSANLQFFELYNLGEIYQSLQDVQPVLKDYLTGKHNDTSYNEKAVIDSFNAKLKDSVFAKSLKPADQPIFALVQGLGQPRADEKGQQKFPAEVAYVDVKDTALLGDYLRLSFISDNFPSNLRFVFGYVGGGDDEKSKNLVGLYALKMPDATGVALLEGKDIADASFDYIESKPGVRMQMTTAGGKLWGDMTTKNQGKPVAIVLDNYVRSAPNVNEPITGGNSSISGGNSSNVQEYQDLADILKSGPLSAPAKIVQEQQVGATLSEDTLNGGTMAFAIAFLIIFALMLIYYNTSGWVANAALILNLFFTIGTLASIGANITAAGIAGLVLTIGMAVDTNVIIFERIKEELTLGKSYQNAVNAGYRRSLAPVLDSHVTTFLTAAILFYFGLGPVRGFATTQMIGIVLNLFCGILLSRLMTEWFTNKQKHLNYFTGISKKVFAHAQFKFIEFRKVAYIISIVVLLAGVGSIFYGFDYGVEFEGGRSYTVKFDKKHNPTEVAEALKPTLGEAPIVKTVGNDGNQLNITTAFKIHESGANVDSLVEKTVYTGLQKFLPAGTTFIEFEKTYKVGSQTVLPTISDDLKKGATKATIISIIIICFYIFIRFRDWRYSLGTIVSLLHDVFVTLAVFSFARKFVPFPLEIDQHFIAAILTVIGFSMNDTIIVFDRIRENSHGMPGADKGIIINKSINQTLSRTIMTSLTVFLTILVLFIFGGDVTRGFAFAMLIGVLVGTYSSIFVAAPILMDFGRNRPLGEAPKADPLALKKKVTA